MKEQNFKFYSLLIQQALLAIYGLMVFWAFLSSDFSRFIHADWIILILVGLIFLSLIVGTVVSTTAFFNMRKKTKPLTAIAFNVGLIIFFIYFRQAYLMELSLFI